MKKFYLLPIIFAISLSITCKGIHSESNFVESNKSIADNIDEQEIASDLKTTIEKIQNGEITKLKGEVLFAEGGLPLFYEEIGYVMIWLDPTKANEAISQLTMAWKEGLNPLHYHLETILDLQNAIKSNPNDKSSQIVLDILLTDGLMEYGYNLNYGRLDPKSLNPSWNFPARHFANDALEQFITAINNHQIKTFMAELPPQNNLYQLVKKALITYTGYVRNGGWESLSISASLHPLEETSLAPQLRKRLIAEGYKIENSSSQIYDEGLVEQVKLFQKSSGLSDDGVIGKNTIKAFNETAESKLNKLRISLERSRWVDIGEVDEFIVVNIAYYYMYYIDRKKAVYSSKVMVGKVNKQTPIFRDDLTMVVLNPTWTLPFSISSTETLGKLKKDPQYLQKHNMVLLNSKGAIVSDQGIDWNKYQRGHFPYTVRQEPGPHNALGQVKFLFPNKYAVYLHDTPSKSLFSKEARAFSHGCIRLQNPLNFALFLLDRDDPGNWSMEKIQEIVKTEKTNNIKLKTSIPIYLMYWTAAIDEYGQVYFVKDIYDRDPAIIKALN